MIIKIIEKEDMEHYESCAKDYGTVFNSLDWLSLFDNKVQIYGLYTDGVKLIGGFCVYRRKRFGLPIYSMPPLTSTIGPFLKIDAKNPSSVMDTWKEALSMMAEFFDDLPYAIISFSLSSNVVDTQPFIWKKFKVVPGYTYIIDLQKPPEVLWQNLSKKHRHDITKAKKDGLMIKQITDMNIVKGLCLKTFQRQRKNIDTYHLDKILFEFAAKGQSYAFATFKNEIPIAATFFVHDKYTSHALLGGYDCENRHHGAGTLTDWEGLIHAKNMGLKYFDFEGSMVPQIERYFRGFGGQLIPSYRINKAKLPLEIALKFFKRELF